MLGDDSHLHRVVVPVPDLGRGLLQRPTFSKAALHKLPLPCGSAWSNSVQRSADSLSWESFGRFFRIDVGPRTSMDRLQTCYGDSVMQHSFI